MHLLGISRLHEDGGLGPLLGDQEVLVHGPRRQQGGHRQATRTRHTVGEDDDGGGLPVTLAHHPLQSFRGLLADGVQGLGQTLRPAAGGEGGVDDPAPPLSLELGVLDGLHLLQGDDGVGHQQALAVLRPRLQQVLLRTHRASQTHDHLLADGVDGRVGHLCEELLEVVKHGARPLAEHGQGGVIPHGAQGLLAPHPHGEQQHVQGLHAVPKHVQAPGGGVEVEAGFHCFNAGSPSLEVHQIVVEPLLIRLLCSNLLLDLLVGDDAPLLKVHQEHLARLQAVLAFDDGLGQVRHHPDL
mmetsp:Transcript_1882/g.2655  ORF Transcript_1882/g.2655 Transcript_1882/m.2655 type:complete len:298 (+) Transcript_1882:2542-3435(+)